MAKVIIDIPNKTIEAVKAVMLAQCETEDQEQEVVQTCDHLLNAEDPFPFDVDRVKTLFENDPDKGLLIQQLNQLYAALTMLVIGIGDLDKL